MNGSICFFNVLRSTPSQRAHIGLVFVCTFRKQSAHSISLMVPFSGSNPCLIRRFQAPSATCGPTLNNSRNLQSSDVIFPIFFSDRRIITCSILNASSIDDTCSFCHFVCHPPVSIVAVALEPMCVAVERVSSLPLVVRCVIDSHSEFRSNPSKMT